MGKASEGEGGAAAGVPRRVLVANRGEIAVRLLRGLRGLGRETVAVHSEADAGSPHVRAADRAICLGPPNPAESYLDVERIIAACRATGADAVHPGYGFLSENADFAERVEGEGLTFIGPTPDSIRLLGDKTAALSAAERAGLPTVPSHLPEPAESVETLRGAAATVGFPLLIKAAAGGGGKGMRIAHHPGELDELTEAAQREAEGAFGDARIFLERYLARARHVEVQVVGDGRGGGLAYGQRDCSVQRRHQKLIEETPAPGLREGTRRGLEGAALALVREVSYRGAGTVEFLLAPDGEYFFLEMNTRLQVEHPVTELVHGVDLVALQVRVAAGAGLPAEVSPPRGHALEVRIYAEDPASGFLPSTGVLDEVVWPQGPGIRVDAGVERGGEVTVHYDPLLAKIIAWGDDREHAIERMRDALAETFVAGVETTTAFCRDLLDCAAFRAGDLHTTFIAEHFDGWRAPMPEAEWARATELLALHFAGDEEAGASAARESRLPGPWQTLAGWRHGP